MSVATASPARTRREPSSSRSIVAAADSASAVETTGRAGTTSRRSVEGSVRRPRLSAARSTPVPERASTTRRVSVPTTTVASRGGSPKRWSSRFARRAAGTGASRNESGTSGPPPSPSRARTRFAVPPSSAASSAASSSGSARSSAPVVAAVPVGPRSVIGRVTRRAAASLTAVRASSSVRPPTGTPPIVVPRARLSRSSRATRPTAAARATRAATTTAPTTSARRPRRRGRVATDMNGPDMGTTDGSERPRAGRPVRPVPTPAA